MPRYEFTPEAQAARAEYKYLEDYIGAQLQAEFDYRMKLEIHKLWYGCYMGPALCMVDPTKIGYVPWVLDS